MCIKLLLQVPSMLNLSDITSEFHSKICRFIYDSSTDQILFVQLAVLHVTQSYFSKLFYIVVDN
jgi:hypothetical protein